MRGLREARQGSPWLAGPRRRRWPGSCAPSMQQSSASRRQFSAADPERNAIWRCHATEGNKSFRSASVHPSCRAASINLPSILFGELSSADESASSTARRGSGDACFGRSSNGETATLLRAACRIASRVPLATGRRLAKCGDVSSSIIGLSRDIAKEECRGISAVGRHYGRSRRPHHWKRPDRILNICSRSLSTAAAVARGSAAQFVTTISPISSVTILVAVHRPRTSAIGSPGK